MLRAARPAMDRSPPCIARGGWLDALRVIVGALIILYHFREAAPVPLGRLHPVFDRGYLLTDFFIIDSGYVLARIHGDRLARLALSQHPPHQLGSTMRRQPGILVHVHSVLLRGRA